MENNSYKIYASQDWVSEKHNWDELKNKPFGEEYEITELVSEVQLTINSTDEPVYPFEFRFVGEDNYTIIWDGISYECVSHSIQDSGAEIVIGNGDIVGYEFENTFENNNEPFAIYWNRGSVAVWSREVGSHTLAVAKTNVTIKTIDTKYLPEHLQFGERTVTNILVDNLTSEEYHNGNRPQCNFVVGNSYNVIWNGTLYENIVCQDSGGYKIISIDNNSVYFEIGTDSSNVLYMIPNVGVTATVFESSTTINKIDPKYLPDTVATLSDIEAAIGTAIGGSY